MTALTLARRLSAEIPRATLVLLPSLGTTHHIWDGVLAELPGANDLDVLLFDLPGHGDAPPGEVADLPAVASGTAARVREEHRNGPVVVAGVSVGGALALEIARRHPDLVARFAMLNSALRFGTPVGWVDVRDAVRRAGTAATDVGASREGWFTPGYTGSGAEAVVARHLAELAAVDVESYLSCCSGLARYDGAVGLSDLVVPGVAVGATQDRSTPSAGMRAVVEVCRGVEYVEVPGAHLAVVEEPAAVAAVLVRLLRAAQSAGSGVSAPGSAGAARSQGTPRPRLAPPQAPPVLPTDTEEHSR